MTPPDATVTGNTADVAGAQPAVFVCLHIIRKRSDFLKAAKSARRAMPGFVIQARKRNENDNTDPQAIRIGYTCSKKVGNAVARNRAKRRLREIARKVLPTYGQAGWDYVLIGRANSTASTPLSELIADLKRALIKLHQTDR